MFMFIVYFTLLYFKSSLFIQYQSQAEKQDNLRWKLVICLYPSVLLCRLWCVLMPQLILHHVHDNSISCVDVIYIYFRFLLILLVTFDMRLSYLSTNFTNISEYEYVHHKIFEYIAKLSLNFSLTQLS